MYMHAKYTTSSSANFCRFFHRPNDTLISIFFEYMVLKAYRYRFYPHPALILFLAKTFGCCRFVYNYFLAARKKHYEENRKTLPYSECSSMLAELKTVEVWLQEVSSVALQQSLRHLESAFSRFFQKKGHFPKFKKRFYEQKASFMKNAFTFKNGELKLAKCDQPLNIRWSRKFQGEPTSITITLDQRGRYYVSILVEEFIKPLPRTDQTVGIDLGLTHSITTSDGKKEEPGNFLKKQLKRLRRVQRAFSGKKKGSANAHKSRRVISKLCGKIRERRIDYLHKKSRTLVNENQVICVENLAVKNMMKNRRLARGIADSGWGTLINFLKYKCGWYGRQFVQIDRYFPSSKQCFQCKKINEALTLSDRLWRCSYCNCEHDRDVTAANNIKEEGLRLINWSTVGHTGYEACGANIRPTGHPAGNLL
jgi:putative transposase